MAWSGQSAPTMQQITEMQDQILVDTGIRLELTGGLALGVVDGVEKLCLLCPGCRKPTVGVNAWAQCGHCRTQLTRLGPKQEEVRYYFASSTTGLWMPQATNLRRAGEGCTTPEATAEDFQPDSKESDTPEVQVGSVGEACGLVGDLEAVEVTGQSLEEHPEIPASLSKPLVETVWKEPQVQEGDPLGELDREGKGWAIDWGSPEVLDRYGSLEHLFVWSSHKVDDSSVEDEWFVESSTSVSASTGAPESTAIFPEPPVPPIKCISDTPHN